MVRRTVQIPVFPANGGLNSAANPSIIDQTQMSYSNNIFYGVDQIRKTRPGRKLFSAAGTETTNMKYLFDFWRYNSISGSQSNQVIRIINGKFQVDANAIGSFVDYTNSFTINPTDNITSDVFSGLLILAFKNRYPLMWNGRVLSLLEGSPRQGSIYRTHANQGFLSGIPGDPHAIDVSYPDDPLTWTGTGTETIRINDGDRDPVGVTSLFPSFYGDLYVGKWESIYRLQYDYNLEIFTVALMLSGIGCVSHNSVVAVQNDVLFVSDRGVHSLMTTQKYGDVESQFLSAPIQDVFKKEIDFTRSEEMQGVYIPDFNTYALTVPIRGYSGNRDMLMLNILNGQWTRHRDIDASNICIFRDSRKKRKLMNGHSNGVVSYFDEDTFLDFDTDAINAEFHTGVIYPGGVKKVVSFKSLTCIYKPQGESKFQVDYVIDGLESGTVEFNQSGSTRATDLGPNWILGQTNLGVSGGTGIKRETKTLSGNGSGIQLRFKRYPSGDNIDQGIELVGFLIDVFDSDTSDESTVQ